MYLYAMKYTHYFGMMTKEQGHFNLSTEQFQRMMNIVHLEGVINGLDIAKRTYEGTNLYYRYDALIAKQNDKLFGLTHGNSPELLLCEMVKVSCV
jgi:hypothetical protein